MQRGSVPAPRDRDAFVVDSNDDPDRHSEPPQQVEEGDEAARLPDPDRLRDIFRLAPIGIGIVDRRGHTIHTNDALRALLGYDAEEFARLRFEEFTHPDDIERNNVLFARMMAGDLDRFELDKRFFARDGAVVWGRLTVSLIRDGVEPALAIGMLEDITEQRRLQDELARAEQTYRLLVEQVPAVVYVTEAAAGAPWRYVSPQIEALLGYRPDEWLADTSLWRRRVHPADLDGLSALLDELIERGETASRILTYRMSRRDGRQIWVRDQTQFDVDPDGTPLLRGVLVDITREKVLEARLEHLAFHDPLTGLANRELFLDRLAHRLRRRSDQRAGTLLYLDLDGFKDVNDRLGHDIGDGLLCSIAERLRATLRPSDTIGRLGGDEFAVLIEDLDDPADIAAATARIQTAVGAPHQIGGQTVLVGSSIGVTDLGEAEDADAALRNADLAMYQAKAAGKGQVVHFTPHLRETAAARLDLREALIGALEREEFSLRLQPVVAMRSTRVWAVEALAWWHHPEAGPVSVEVFTPLAVELGLSEGLGRWLLGSGLDWLAGWQRHRGALDLSLVVELPAKLLHHPGLPADLEAALGRRGLPADDVMLVVPEHALVSEAVRSTMTEVHELGVRTAVGDYGTGYASLEPLADGTADLLRLDHRLVDELALTGERTLATALLQLASVLGVEVCAVGVDTLAQWQSLVRLGCPLGQGALFSPPLAPAELEDRLAQPLRPDLLDVHLPARG